MGHCHLEGASCTTLPGYSKPHVPRTMIQSIAGHSRSTVTRERTGFNRYKTKMKTKPQGKGASDCFHLDNGNLVSCDCDSRNSNCQLVCHSCEVESPDFDSESPCCKLVNQSCQVQVPDCDSGSPNCNSETPECDVENLNWDSKNFDLQENLNCNSGSPDLQCDKSNYHHTKRVLRWTLWQLFLGMVICQFFTGLPGAAALPPIIKIGAMFTEDQREGPTELAFKYAVYRINKDSSLLPNTTLVYDIQYVPKDDSFHASKKACEQIYFGIQAVFGPSDPLLGSHIQSICDALDIPHIEARLDLEPEFKEFSINLYPSHEILNGAFQDVMSFLNWTKVAIIYEEDMGLIKLQELVKNPPKDNMEFLIRQGNPSNYRELLKEIKQKEVYSIIVDTEPENMNHFLRGILQLQMNDYKYHYLFTTFDIETFDLEDFKYNFVNMTAFRLVDSDHHHVRDVLKDMEKFQPIGHHILNSTRVIQKHTKGHSQRHILAEPALMYDSVYVFALGLQALELSTTLRVANLSCEHELPWVDGSSLFNYINSVAFRGITGPIKFQEGRRSNFKLDLLKLKAHSLVRVGEWSPGNGVNITDRAAFYDPGTMNVTLLVTTNLAQPFMNMHPGKNFTGNGRFYGFCVDLLYEVAMHAGFDYIIELSPDKVYGVADPITGEWNGVVRQLMSGKADLAIGSMTINYARESVIDFTKPFMNVGISILFKVPTSQQTRLFSFMNPLAIEIWLYILAAYVLVSITMFIVARFSPYEWHNPHPCSQENDIVENHFSLSNSFWFTIGTLMQQGSDLNPKACSTRIVGGIWWFFTLIIISSYTANLAAFLTVERMITPIDTADDLAGQDAISYGTQKSGSTMSFFRDSKIETYQKMWRFMENKKPSVFVDSYDEGIRRVLEGNYAFLMESSMLDYYVQRNCNLTQIGGLLDSKSYGIATPMGSPWRDKISLAILELQEKGVIQMLYNRWWKNTGDTCNREEKGKENKASALGVDNIGGVFVVLLCGLAFAVLIAILEFCWNAKRNAQLDRGPELVPTGCQSLCSEMAEELCFAMRCRGSKQRPALKRQCSRCVPGATYVPQSIDMPHINGHGRDPPLSLTNGNGQNKEKEKHILVKIPNGIQLRPPLLSVTEPTDSQETVSGYESGGDDINIRRSASNLGLRLRSMLPGSQWSLKDTQSAEL